MYLTGRTLARFSGRAMVAGETVPWSLVLKVLQPQTGVTNPHRAVWQREVLAYQSGLLADLPGGLTTPRMLELTEDKQGSFWLWLEEVSDIFGREWRLAQFRVAARALGAFNGVSLANRPLPTFPWLVTNWTSLHSEPHLISDALAEIVVLSADSRVRAAFPYNPAEQMTALLRDQPIFVDILTRLPQTLCHHDASQANLFARTAPDGSDQIVAIDWESIGHGTVAADMATLVFGTIRRGLFPAEYVTDLEHEALAGYIEGLQIAGWQGDPGLVRVAYTAAVALRWFMLSGTLRVLTDYNEPAGRGMVAEAREHSVEQFVVLSKYLLECAGEARELARRYSLAG